MVSTIFRAIKLGVGGGEAHTKYRGCCLRPALPLGPPSMEEGRTDGCVWGHAHLLVVRWGWGSPLPCQFPGPAWQPSGPVEWSRAGCLPTGLLGSSSSPESKERKGRGWRLVCHWAREAGLETHPCPLSPLSLTPPPWVEGLIVKGEGGGRYFPPRPWPGDVIA